VGSIKWPKTLAKEAALTGKNAIDALGDKNNCLVVATSRLARKVYSIIHII